MSVFVGNLYSLDHRRDRCDGSFRRDNLSAFPWAIIDRSQQMKTCSAVPFKILFKI